MSTRYDDDFRDFMADIDAELDKAERVHNDFWDVVEKNKIQKERITELNTELNKANNDFWTLVEENVKLKEEIVELKLELVRLTK